MSTDKTEQIQISLLRAADDPRENEPQYQAELRDVAERFRAAGLEFGQRARAFDAIDTPGYSLGVYLLQHIPKGAVAATVGAIGTWLTVRTGRHVRLKVRGIEAEAHTVEEIERLIDNAVAVENYLTSESKEMNALPPAKSGVQRFVRIRAEAVKEDNPEALPLHLDMVIDEEGNVVGAAPIFGCEGEINRAGGDSQPFILYESGRMDYGLSFANPSERYYELNLRQGRIVNNRLLTLTGESGFQEQRRITEIRSLVHS